MSLDMLTPVNKDLSGKDKNREKYLNVALIKNKYVHLLLQRPRMPCSTFLFSSFKEKKGIRKK